MPGINLDAESFARDCIDNFKSDIIAHWLEQGTITASLSDPLEDRINTWISEQNNYVEYTLDDLNQLRQKYGADQHFETSMRVSNLRDFDLLVSNIAAQIFTQQLHAEFQKLYKQIYSAESDYCSIYPEDPEEGEDTENRDFTAEWTADENIESGVSTDLLIEFFEYGLESK